MSKASAQDRLAQKTPENAFVRTLRDEFHFSPRLSEEVLQAAQEALVGTTPASTVRPGQTCLVVANIKAPFGPPLAETELVEVILTVDAGEEDWVVKKREGLVGRRRGRILRLIDEALEQGGVLTQEDLGRVLGVDSRTIRRDVQALKADGHLVHTRGRLQGVGRGQTHKVKIIELWLDREGYEKISRWLHHSPQAIKRYVSTFLRMVVLHQKGLTVEEIAFLTRSSIHLVQEYLTVLEAAQSEAHRREKLTEELTRVQDRQKPLISVEKRGVKPT